MANTLQIIAAGHSEIGPKDENKDSYNFVNPQGDELNYKGAVAVIADGVSSCEGGGKAAQTSTKTFIEDYYSTSDAWSVKKSSQKVLSALNRWLYRNGQSDDSILKGWVTTFSAIILKSNTAHLFHIGDSRIYRFRDGDLEQLTHDHTVRQSKAQSYLARALGIDVNLDVDYLTIQLEEKDIFLLTTDGLHGFVSDGQMKQHLCVSAPMAEMAHRLVAQAVDNQSDDNITALVVQIDVLPQETEDEAYQRLNALPFPPDLSPGNTIDGFKILQALSESARGQVYLAEDVANGEKLVLKTPSVNYEDDPRYLNGFIQEEWIGRKVSHPGLLRTYDAGRRKNFLYYTSEFVDGITLRQWMHDHPTPELAQIRPIIDQLTQALRVLHRQDMIHQDLKPENIMIDHGSQIKIIDFGSTKVAGIAEISSKLNGDHPMGTLNYTAPEYMMNEKGSNCSDIYALGVIAYEMLSGNLPYKELERFNLKSYKALKYRPIRMYRKDIPDWIDYALAKAVAANPAHRYTLLSEFYHDFTTPTKVSSEHAVPLMERNPLLFWKSLSAFLLMLCVVLLVNCLTK